MSDIETSPVRLEDGEIEEGNEPSVSTPSTDGRKNSLLFPFNQETNADKSDNDEIAIIDKSECRELKKRSATKTFSLKEAYQQHEDESDLVDEDEMLCVRGASPVLFVVSAPYDSDSLTMDMTSPKRRKTSGKRGRRKRTTPKKILKEKSISSDDQHDSKSIEGSQSPSKQKLHQLCKFYLQECCAKGRSCEYMHSEFPCKFFYMGLKCEDEVNRGRCKLSHGGTLSYEMLVALIRHIHTAPNDVLGKRFVELRDKMPAGETSKMLHQMQEKLQLPEEKSEPSNSKLNFFTTLREKMYFLSEEQIDKLQQLPISKAEDLLYLNLAQLNAIGIHAIQIEAIQMSLIAGQDMDMRNIFPPSNAISAQPVEAVLQTKDIDSRELDVNKKEGNTIEQCWYEDEEQPLVIDESDEGDVEKDKSIDIEIDVVGITSPSPLILSENSKGNDDNGEEEKPTVCTNNLTVDILPIVEAMTDKSINKVSPKKSIHVSTLEKVILGSGRLDYPNEPPGRNINFPVDGSWKSQRHFQKDYGRDTDLQMQGDNSSEDWDAELQKIENTASKEIDSIDSPDNSEDEATALVGNGICPELPLRTPNLDNYKPALEIDAHLTYPAMEYKLYEIYLPDCEVNKPPLIDKLIKSNSTDPRLRKFIEKEKNYGIFPQSDYSFFPPTMSQCDPRLRPGYGNTCPDQYYNASPILYGYLQRSIWYQELKSNIKIQINHSVSDLVRALNAFHKNPSPKKIFDFFQIDSAGVLLEVMRNVGILVDVNGNITEESNYQQLCTPQQTTQPYNNNSNSGGPLPPLKPGLLGYAPPGITYPPHPHMAPLNNENSFMRQAFGNEYFGNNNNEFEPPESGFYVPERNFNRNHRRESDFEPAFRRPPKRNFKRRL